MQHSQILEYTSEKMIKINDENESNKEVEKAPAKLNMEQRYIQFYYNSFFVRFLIRNNIIKNFIFKHKYKKPTYFLCELI
jgi:hypothetical protein